ncbi:SPOSA6832_05141, partial [Sporobolomyces salmonicolor]
MLSSLFSSPSVTITLEEDQIFVHPVSSDYPVSRRYVARLGERPAHVASLLQTQDPIIRGTVLISLPSKRAIKRIKVVLEGLCDAYGGVGSGRYETTTSLQKQLEQHLDGEIFEAGNHAFNFAFIVPSSTAVSQRSNYGRLRHYVKATVDFEGRLMGSVTSAPTALWVAANPSAPGELPYPTDISFEHFSADLGPVGIHVSSPHLTVSALMNVRLSLLGPPQPVTIISVNGVISQTFEVHFADGEVTHPKSQNFTLTKVDQRASPSLTVPIHNPTTCPINPGSEASLDTPTTETPPLSRGSSFLSSAASSLRSRPSLSPGVTTTTSPASTIPPTPSFRPVSKCCTILPDEPVPDPSPLVHLQTGEEFNHTRICRVPDDDHVRPSTLEGTEASIRVSHKMSVEVRYRKEGDEEDMVLTIGKPITITSWFAPVSFALSKRPRSNDGPAHLRLFFFFVRGRSCCLVDYFYLPAYSASAPTRSPITRTLVSRCACNMSLKEVFDRDGQALQRAAAIDSPLSGEARLLGFEGLDREGKSPAWTGERALYREEEGEG